MISTGDPEFAASLSPDGVSFYFNRASADRSRLSTLVSHFRDVEWGPPETAPFSGTHRDADPFVSPDGRRLYFSSSRPTEPGDETPDFNSWLVEKEGGGWSAPIVLPEPLSTASHEPSGLSGSGRAARSVTFMKLRGWSRSTMNLEGGGGNPWFSSYGKLLIFVGSRSGGQDADLYSVSASESRDGFQRGISSRW